MGRNHCQACSNERFGVFTRKPIHHTCGLDWRGREDRKRWILEREKALEEELAAYLRKKSEGGGGV